MKSDVLLFTGVFHSFRKITFTTYNLDPSHYFTAPGISWDAMFKPTGVSLQLFDDPGMYLMIVSGILDGVTKITTKFLVLSNPLVENFDANKLTNYLMYLDANNLDD